MMHRPEIEGGEKCRFSRPGGLKLTPAPASLKLCGCRGFAVVAAYYYKHLFVAASYDIRLLGGRAGLKALHTLLTSSWGRVHQL
jgi:hypothetical protein